MKDETSLIKKRHHSHHYETLIHQHRLMQYFKRGILPIPKESVISFFERAESSVTPTSLPKIVTDFNGPEKTTAPVHYHDEGIHFWEVALTWIDHQGRSEIQLRKALEKGSYLGYSQEEVLAHETVHALRAPLFSERFEECFAYATSSSSWRRVLGPLFSEKWAVLLIFLVCLGVGYFFIQGPWWLIPFFISLPIGYFFLRFYPWFALQYTLSQLRGPTIARQIPFLLTDAQIVELSSQKTVAEIEGWIDGLGDGAQRCLIESLWHSSSVMVWPKQAIRYLYGI